MTAKEAYRIAAKGRRGKLAHCYELDTAFAFYFEEGDGTPFILIDKKTGKEKLMFIPPISNIALLEKGKAIPIAEII